MKELGQLIAIAAALASAPSAAAAASIQAANLKGNATRANAVKQLYVSAFSNYLKYAKGADELAPLSRKGVNNFLGGWGATMVDSISTSHFMNLTDQVAIAEDWMVNRVNYTVTSQQSISVFETTIRHVAGLVSAYELGGFKNKGLIKQAQTLADILLRAWEPNVDLPYNTLVNWGPNTAKPDSSLGPATASIAEAGTLILEFDRLSKHSGNATYRRYAKRAEDALVRARSRFPGLRYQEYITHYDNSNTTQLTPATSFISYGGGSDSFYEYLLKYPLLTGNTKSSYLGTWITATKSAIKYLVQSPRNKNGTYFLSDVFDNKVYPEFSHLGCFAPGNFILGAQVLQNDALLQWGLRLAQGCIDTYRATPSRIGPEAWTYRLRDPAASENGTNGVPYTDSAFSRSAGFSVNVADYVLRPEVLESVFYAYRVTGDQRWADYAWDAFQAIRRVCGTSDGSLASIDDVTKSSPTKADQLPSFAFAELLKYLYLTFADPAVGSLDKYVYNTEAHPFLRDNAGADYSGVVVGTVPTPLMKASY